MGHTCYRRTATMIGTVDAAGSTDTVSVGVGDGVVSAGVASESVGDSPATESVTTAVSDASVVSIAVSAALGVSATESTAAVVSATGVTGAGVGASDCWTGGGVGAIGASLPFPLTIGMTPAMASPTPLNNPTRNPPTTNKAGDRRVFCGPGSGSVADGFHSRAAADRSLVFPKCSGVGLDVTDGGDFSPSTAGGMGGSVTGGLHSRAAADRSLVSSKCSGVDVTDGGAFSPSTAGAVGGSVTGGFHSRMAAETSAVSSKSGIEGFGWGVVMTGGSGPDTSAATGSVSAAGAS